MTMIAILMLFVLSCCFWPTAAFLPPSTFSLHLLPLSMSAPESQLPASRHPFDDLMTALLSVFPDVFAPSKPMDPAKLNTDPPRWTRRGGSGWRKARKSDTKGRLYYAEDVIEAFNSRFVGISPEKAQAKARQLSEMLDELDDLELLESLDEYGARTGEKASEDDPLTAAERFVAEGLAQSLSPMDSTVDPLKVEKEARPFHRPVKLSALRKVLKQDPTHFE